MKWLVFYSKENSCHGLHKLSLNHRTTDKKIKTFVRNRNGISLYIVDTTNHGRHKHGLRHRFTVGKTKLFDIIVRLWDLFKIKNVWQLNYWIIDISFNRWVFVSRSPWFFLTVNVRLRDAKLINKWSSS